MGKLTPAQDRAIQKYRETHADNTVYTTARRQARAFIQPKGGTKLAKVINGITDYSYYDDLVELKKLIEDRLKEI